MKVSMENEAEDQQMGAPGLGGRGGVRMGLREPEGGLPSMEETQGEDIRKHHPAHTVVFFSTSSIVSFLCFLSPGRTWIGLAVRARWGRRRSQPCCVSFRAVSSEGWEEGRWPLEKNTVQQQLLSLWAEV